MKFFLTCRQEKPMTAIPIMAIMITRRYDINGLRLLILIGYIAMQKSGENIDKAELVAVYGTLVKVQALECGKRR